MLLLLNVPRSYIQKDVQIHLTWKFGSFQSNIIWNNLFSMMPENIEQLTGRIKYFQARLSGSDYQPIFAVDRDVVVWPNCACPWRRLQHPRRRLPSRRRTAPLGPAEEAHRPACKVRMNKMYLLVKAFFCVYINGLACLHEMSVNFVTLQVTLCF